MQPLLNRRSSTTYFSISSDLIFSRASKARNLQEWQEPDSGGAVLQVLAVFRIINLVK